MLFRKDGLRFLHARMHECLGLVISHAGLLPAEALSRPLPGFGHPTLLGQLIHVLSTESAWVCGLQRLPVVRLDPRQHPGLPDISRAQEEVRARTAAYLDRLSDEALNTELGALPPQWIGPNRPPAFILLHVITHAFHHKGQMVTMLRILGHPAPDTDLQRG